MAALQESRWRRLQMTGDEAAGRVAQIARGDIRQLFNDDGLLLPIQDWPDSVAPLVKAIRFTKDGPVVTIADAVVALRMVLEQTGKLKNVGAAVGELARLLAGDIEEPDDA